MWVWTLSIRDGLCREFKKIVRGFATMKLAIGFILILSVFLSGTCFDEAQGSSIGNTLSFSYSDSHDSHGSQHSGATQEHHCPQHCSHLKLAYAKSVLPMTTFTGAVNFVYTFHHSNPYLDTFKRPPLSA